jgi:hypothetical protein
MRVFLMLVIFTTPGTAGVRGDSSRYVAGTVTSCKAGQIGSLELGDQAIVFTANKDCSPITILYQSISAMDYGEHVGRRVGLAIAVAWPLIFSHKKRHYLTIYFNADPRVATEQRDALAKDSKASPKGDMAAFEVSKNVYASEISILQAKTGVTVRKEEVAR